MSRFLVAVASSTPEQDLSFKNALTGMAWWHWIPNFWLITDSENIWDALRILEQVKVSYPNVNCFIQQLDDDGTRTYSGLVPNPNVEVADKWLKDYWLLH